MAKDFTQPMRIGRIRALNGCAGRLFGYITHDAFESQEQGEQPKYIIPSVWPIFFLINIITALKGSLFSLPPASRIMYFVPAGSLEIVSPSFTFLTERWRQNIEAASGSKAIESLSVDILAYN